MIKVLLRRTIFTNIWLKNTYVQVHDSICTYAQILSFLYLSRQLRVSTLLSMYSWRHKCSPPKVRQRKDIDYLLIDIMYTWFSVTNFNDNRNIESSRNSGLYSKLATLWLKFVPNNLINLYLLFTAYYRRNLTTAISAYHYNSWQFFFLFQNDQNWFPIESKWPKKNPEFPHCVFPIKLPRSVF